MKTPGLLTALELRCHGPKQLVGKRWSNMIGQTRSNMVKHVTSHLVFHLHGLKHHQHCASFHLQGGGGRNNTVLHENMTSVAFPMLPYDATTHCVTNDTACEHSVYRHKDRAIQSPSTGGHPYGRLCCARQTYTSTYTTGTLAAST